MIDTTKEIRMLTVRQPFALLLFAGKSIETRSRPTGYRGKVLITVSKRSYSFEELKRVCTPAQYQSIIKWYDPNDVYIKSYEGRAIGVVDLYGCKAMEKKDATAAMVKHNKNIFSWQIRSPKRVDTFPIKGFVGLTSVAEEVKKKIREHHFKSPF